MFESIAMFGENPMHWVIVLVIVLLLFGPGRIKELMGGLGSGMKEFKKGLKEEEEDKGKTESKSETSGKP